MMDYHDIRLLLELPAVRLLRSPNAAMLLAFLQRAFKSQQRLSIPEGQLRELLQTFLDELRESDPSAFPQTTSQYLDAWCDETHGFLKKYYVDAQTEPVFELTSGAEKALLWLESLRESKFVGTESRLESIFDDLHEILNYASSDPDKRIEQLTAQSDAIRAEIDRIRVTGAVDTFTPVQIQERFGRVLATARELMGDFRQVEENFKRIAQEIAERHSRPGVTKGAIVGHMLDSHDALRQSAQGQSFYAFWELLLSPDKQAEFHEAVERAYDLEAIGDDLRGDRLLRHLISRLLREGEKVVQSHQRMSTSLRRVLDTISLQERRQILELIRDVQAAALATKDNPPSQEDFFEIEHFPSVFSAMRRELWRAKDSVVLKGGIELADGSIDLNDLQRFTNLPQIQLRKLRENVATCLNGNYSVTLEQVLDAFPPRHGVIEVLGYLILATQESRHFISEETQVIDLPGPRRGRWNVPRVLFSKG